MSEVTSLLTFVLVTLVLVCSVVAQQQQPSSQPLIQPGQNQPLVANENITCKAVTSKPTPEVKKYAFQTCIVAQLAAHLSIGQGKYIELVNGTVNTASSQCQQSNKTTPAHEPKLVIDFPCGQLMFGINHTADSKTYVSHISGTYTTTEGDHTFANSTPTFYTTQSGHYYKCNSEQEIPVSPGVYLVISNFALEAYRDSQTTDFYQVPEECALDSQPVSDWVRIGVGICLVALVIIVLIAYFVGRRRWSERSSYESV